MCRGEQSSAGRCANDMKEIIGTACSESVFGAPQQSKVDSARVCDDVGNGLPHARTTAKRACDQQSRI